MQNRISQISACVGILLTVEIDISGREISAQRMERIKKNCSDRASILPRRLYSSLMKEKAVKERTAINVKKMPSVCHGVKNMSVASPANNRINDVIIIIRPCLRKMLVKERPAMVIGIV